MLHFHHHPPSPHRTPETGGAVIHWAQVYDALFDRILQPSEASIHALAQVKPGDQVLDVGCGPGRLTLAAQRWVGPTGEAQGIDPSPEMIATARRNAAQAGLAVKFQVSRVEGLPFPDATFDVVVSRLVMHHLSGDLKQRGLAEMRRVLKPGGVCLAVDFEPPTAPFLRLAVWHFLSPGMTKIDVRDYVPLLTEAGFAEVETGPTGSKFLSFVRGRSPEISNLLINKENTQ
ncbi:MAG: class I SAM-dependent methyltransferase [Chloroflexi bacterium]|nr:class I SAM-dependent methyltransferase [Chloroflexota bacterium]